MFLNDDDMVECPYDKTHRMLRKRLQAHLLKCRVNYPNVELRKCPFNITHLIPEPEFTHHATNCPDRKLITQYKYDAPQKEEEVPKHAPIECDENWNDTDVNDYNPQLYIDSANVIRKPDGVNRSERKLFIKHERKRLGDYDDEETEDCETSLCTKRKREDSFNDADDDLSFVSFRNEVSSQTSRSKRSISPSTSFYSKERLRSSQNRNRSRSPRRSYKHYSTGRYKSDQEIYKNRVNGYTNNQFNSGRDVYSEDNCDRYIDTNSTMPEAPPPPIISYPAPRSYLPTRPSLHAFEK